MPSDRRFQPGDTCTLESFLETLDYPILWLVSYGQPAGTEFAVLEKDVVPEGALEAFGEIADNGFWRWDGHGDLRDWGNNTVTGLQAREDKKLYVAEEEEDATMWV